MNVLTGSDLFTNSWNTLYKTISGNVVDPQTRTGSQWIFADYPLAQDGKTHNHPGFPIITIDSFENDGNSYTFDKMENSLMTNITVHTNNKRHVDVLSSDIHSTIMENRKTLGASGMHNIKFTMGGRETIAMDRDNKIHTKTIGLGADVVL